jgi:DNA-binding NtrC family response regulator
MQSEADLEPRCIEEFDVRRFSQFDLVGQSPIFLDALRLIERVARLDAAVLIQGETGTGKELAARAIHYLSPRSKFPFIPLNCGALPDSLVESELFGHERGAFTDAKQANPGLVAQAEGGTLFFDEVEAMTPRAQVVLLRFLQDHQYRPVGGRTTTRSNVRIVASTNVDLEAMVRQREFRRDLLFRFDVLKICMPPLRERGSDCLLLADHFIGCLATQHRRIQRQLHPDTANWMAAYDWPGNVRELKNMMLREFLLTDGSMLKVRCPAQPDFAPIDLVTRSFESGFKPAKARALAEFERSYLSDLLAKTGGNISWAARLSQTDRSALNKLVKKHGISCQQFRSLAELNRP